MLYLRKFLLLLRVLNINASANSRLGGAVAKGSKTSKRQRFGSLGSFGSSGEGPSKEARLLGKIFGHLIFLAYTSFMGYNFSLSLHKNGQSELLPQLVASAVPILTIVMGIFLYIVVLYHSQDIEQLLVLPVPQSMIVLLKLTQASSYSLTITIGFFAPALFVHAYLNNLALAYYFLIIPALIGATLVPTFGLLALLILAVRFSKFAHNQDRFQMFSQVFALLLTLGIVLLANLNKLGSLGQSGSAPLSTIARFSQQPLSYIFPSLPLLAACLNNVTSLYSLLYLGALFLLTLLLLGLVTWLGSKYYIPGALALLSAGAGGANKQIISKDFRSSSPLKALLSQERKRLLRSPTFLNQCLIPLLLLPLLFLLPFILSFTKGEASLASLALFPRLLQDIFRAEAATAYFFTCVISVGLTLFLAGLSPLSSTPISRQGSSFGQLKTMPLKVGTFLLSLLLPGYILTSILPLLCLIILFLWGALPPLAALLSLSSILLGSLVGHCFALSCDLKFPRLNWENEIQAVKNSASALLGAFGGMGLSALVVGFAFLLRYLLPANLSLALLCFGLTVVCLGLGLIFLVRRWGWQLLYRKDIA